MISATLIKKVNANEISTTNKLNSKRFAFDVFEMERVEEVEKEIIRAAYCHLLQRWLHGGLQDQAFHLRWCVDQNYPGAFQATCNHLTAPFWDVKLSCHTRGDFPLELQQIATELNKFVGGSHGKYQGTFMMCACDFSKEKVESCSQSSVGGWQNRLI